MNKTNSDIVALKQMELINMLIEDNEGLKAQLLETRELLRLLTNDYNNLTIWVSKLTSSEGDLKYECGELQKENDRLKKSPDENVGIINKLREENNDLNNVIFGNKTQFEKMKNELFEQKLELDNYRCISERYEIEHQQILERYIQKIMELENQILDLKKTIESR